MSQYTVKFLNLEDLYLQYSYLHFSIGSVHGTTITVSYKPTQCREIFINHFLALASPGIKTNIRIVLSVITGPATDAERLKATEEALTGGCALINLFSKQYGWSEASFVKTANVTKLSTYERVLHSYVLTVSTRWFKSPQLLSLMLLLLPTGNWKAFRKCRSYDDFWQLLEKLHTISKVKSAQTFNFNYQVDIDQLYKYRKLLKLFFDNYNKLFVKARAVSLWDKTLYVNIPALQTEYPPPPHVKYEGVHRLLMGASSNYALSVKMCSLAKENGIKYTSFVYNL